MKAWGLKPKNQEQEQAMRALLNPEIELVVLTGTAGSGKSLLTLAAGLEQVLETKMYKDIIFTRAPVAVGFDMGHLPGDVNEKMEPWLGGLRDSMEYLVGESKITQSIIDTKIRVQALMHVRGRSLMGRYVILDEAQNMPIEEIKVLLTRCGEDTKLVILGDSSQVDNKKLTKQNNGLAKLVVAIEENSHKFIKHINLPDGVRSQLCSWGAEYL